MNPTTCLRVSLLLSQLPPYKLLSVAFRWLPFDTHVPAALSEAHALRSVVRRAGLPRGRLSWRHVHLRAELFQPTDLLFTLVAHRGDRDGPSALTAYFSPMPGSLVHTTHKHAHIRFLKSNATSTTTVSKGRWSSLASAPDSRPSAHCCREAERLVKRWCGSGGRWAQQATAAPLNSLGRRAFHHHLSVGRRLACTSPAGRSEEGAGWVEQKLLNGMGTIMNGMSKDKKKMHSECL